MLNVVMARRARLCAMAMLTIACSRDLDGPPAQTAPLAPARRIAGVVEITFRNIGLPNMTSSAIVGASVAEVEAIRAAQMWQGGARFDLSVPKNLNNTGDSTIQLRVQATGVGATSVNGTRYFHATYDVRNAQKTDSAAFNTERHNLTFIAIGEAGRTINGSPVLVFNTTSGAANPALTLELKPSGLVETNPGGNVEPTSPDVMQIFTEQEVAAFAVPIDVSNPFPYGFVTHHVNGNVDDRQNRTLPASPGPNQFDGVVTFAYRIPLQTPSANDPTTITVLMLALDDSQVRVTQSFEEQTSPGPERTANRATSLDATQIRLLPGGSVPGQPLQSLIQLFCSVRTAGTAANPTANLVTVPCPVPAPQSHQP